MKKLVAALLTLGMTMTAFTGCQSNTASTEVKPTDSNAVASETVAATSTPTTDLLPQTKPVKMLVEVTGGKDPEEQEKWVQEAERLSGIDIEVIKVSGNDYKTKLTATLASGDDMDIVYMLTKDFQKFYPMGMFEPLTDRVNASDVFSNPDVVPASEWERIKQDDGQLYGIFNKNESARVPLIRKDWLEKLGLSEPKNLDDYYNMFKAFTEKDPDGDGKNNTYGLTLRKIYDIQPYMSSVGLVDGYAKTPEGKLYVPYATEAAIPVYDWLAKVYADGFLDPNFATNSSSNCKEMIYSSKAGLFTYWGMGVDSYNMVGKENDPNYEIAAYPPLFNKDGKGSLTAGQDGNFYILKNSDNKDYAFKFLEFLYSKEGIMLSTIGVEGVDYELKDGQYILTETGKSHALDHGTPIPKANNWKGVPGLELSQNDLDTIQVANQYGVKEVLTPNSSNAYEIVEKYAVQCIMGEMSGAEAVKAMQNELSNKGYIDK